MVYPAIFVRHGLTRPQKFENRPGWGVFLLPQINWKELFTLPLFKCIMRTTDELPRFSAVASSGC